MANKTFALIIGIDHYDNEDIGDLRGSRNDAVHWYRLCTRFLGIPAEQITVLASPPFTAADLGDGADKSTLGAADRAAILAAAEGLGKALSKGDAEGLVTYSGHGVVAGHCTQEIEGADLAICPEDVARQPDGSFDRVIRFGELAEVFTRHGVRDALTIFFDTCYTGSGDADAPPTRHLLGNQASPVAAAVTKALAAEADAVMASRLILGARHWKPAYEVRTGSSYRGAASFAMTTLLEQWSTKSADGVTYFNVSYGDLIHRTRRVIESLGFDQQPFMWGPRELDDLPVLKHGLAINPGETSEAPDGQKDDRQIPVDTGVIMSICFSQTPSGGTATNYVQVIATNDQSSPNTTPAYAQTTEYWYSANGLPSTDSGSTLTMTVNTSTPSKTNSVSSAITTLLTTGVGASAPQAFSMAQTITTTNWLSATQMPQFFNPDSYSGKWQWFLYACATAPFGILFSFGTSDLNGVSWFSPVAPSTGLLPMSDFPITDPLTLTLIDSRKGCPTSDIFNAAVAKLKLALPSYFSSTG